MDEDYESPANYHDLNPLDDSTPATERMFLNVAKKIAAERAAKQQNKPE